MKRLLVFLWLCIPIWGASDAILRKESAHNQLKLVHVPYMRNIQALVEMDGPATQEMLTAFNRTDAIQECLNNKQFPTLIHLLDEGIGNHFSLSALLQKMSDYALEELLKLVLLSDFLGIEKLQDILEEALAKKIEDLWKNMPDVLTPLWDRLPVNIAQRMRRYINPKALIKVTLDREPDHVSECRDFFIPDEEQANIITFSKNVIEVRDCTGKLLNTMNGRFLASNNRFLCYYRNKGFIIKDIHTMKIIKNIIPDEETAFHDYLELQGQYAFIRTYEGEVVLYDICNSSKPIILCSKDDSCSLEGIVVSFNQKKIAVLWSNKSGNTWLEIYDLAGNLIKTHELKTIAGNEIILLNLDTYFKVVYYTSEGKISDSYVYDANNLNLSTNTCLPEKKGYFVTVGFLHVGMDRVGFYHSRSIHITYGGNEGTRWNMLPQGEIVDTISTENLKIPIADIHFNQRSRLLIVKTIDNKQNIYHFSDLTLKELLEITYPNRS